MIKKIFKLFISINIISTQTIVINEINYHSHDDFNTEDWIELYNNTENIINLSNWSIIDENENSFLIPDNILLESNSFIILAQNIELFNYFHPNVLNVIGDLGFGFSSGGDSISLFNHDNELVDVVEYDDEFPWVIEPDGNGSTLELIDPNSDNNNPLNWSSSQLYGSPGNENSNYLRNYSDIKIPSKVKIINNYPNPFNSHTSISFSVKQKGNTIIKIYNLKGEIVEVILNQNMLPGYYEIAWDAQLLHTGIYFLYINNGHSSDTKKISFLK